MKNKILIVFFCIISCFAIAQQEPSKEKKSELNSQQKKLEGTYQIQVINSRNNPFIPANIDEIVTSNRKEDVITYYKISENVRIKILPQNIIDKKDFTPLELIQHIEE